MSDELGDWMTAARPRNKCNAKKISNRDRADNQPDLDFDFDGSRSLWGAGQSGAGPQSPAPARRSLPKPSVREEKLQEELQELKDRFQSLCDVLKCPVCLDILDKDTVLCVNGHSICIKCRGRQEICPSCRKDFSNVKENVTFRQILDILLHKCRHGSCTEMVKPEDDHEMYCCYRTTACKEFDCVWNGPVKDLLNHSLKAHPNILFKDNINNMSTCLHNFDPNEESKFVCLYSAFGHYLWQVRKNDPTTRLLTFTYIPVLNGKPTRDILVKRCFKARKMKYSVTIRITMDENVDHAKENCTSIPSSMLYSFWNKSEKKIYMSVSLTEAVD